MTSSIENEEIPEWCRTEDIPQWLRRYLEAEISATQAWLHSPFVVCGLFQIPEYAAAISRSIGVIPREKKYTERAIKLRKLRQRRLNNGDLTLVAIQSEFALRSKLGNNAMMAQQMVRLVEISQLPNVELRVAPYDIGQYEAQRVGCFIEFFLPDQTVPVIHLEDHGSGRFIDQPEEMAHFSAAFEHARQLALPTDESRKFIASIGKEWENRSDE